MTWIHRALLLGLLVLPWIVGCPAADDDDADDDTSGVTGCTQKEHNATGGIDVAFQDFDVSWCVPVNPVLSFTINDQSEWQELIDEKCTVQGTPPPPPDWLDTMIVGTISRADGCVGHAENVWFVEKQDERVYAYVQARQGDCEEEIVLGTVVTTARSLKVTRFVECDYTF